MAEAAPRTGPPSARDHVAREIEQLKNERAALTELEAQLGTDESNLAACIEIVRAECTRLSADLDGARGHIADVDRQIAAAVEEDLVVTADLESVRRRVRAVDGELVSIREELGAYRLELAEARSVCDATLQHTLQMGYKLRHGLTLEGYGEDEA